MKLNFLTKPICLPNFAGRMFHYSFIDLCLSNPDKDLTGKCARAEGKYEEQEDVFDDGEHPRDRLRALLEKDQEDLGAPWTCHGLIGGCRGCEALGEEDGGLWREALDRECS